MTVAVLIGNSDDKLSQKQWASFVGDTAWAITRCGSLIRFSGASLPFAAWQNACFVFELPERECDDLRAELTAIRERFNQDSVAWVAGETRFI